MRFGATEIILIIILALIVFGGKKLGTVGKSIGRSIRDFKEEVNGVGGDTNEAREANEEKESSEDPSV